MVKILCLHGAGSSSDVIELQLGAVSRLLPKHFDISYFDGEEECDPAPGLGEIYPGPYFCYYRIPSHDNVSRAHAYLHEIVAEEGGFDGVIGFSQGAEVAASLILRHQIEKPFTAPLFRFAVFLCATLPSSWSSEYGVDIAALFEGINERSDEKAYTLTDEANIPPKNKNRNERDLNKEDVEVALVLAENERLKGITKEKLGFTRLHPDHDTVRIQIPTAHVMGKSDPYRIQSYKLKDLCCANLVTTYEHLGGHEIPRTEDSSMKIKNLIEKVAVRGDFVQ